MIYTPILRSTTEPIYRPAPPPGEIDAEALADAQARLTTAKATRDEARKADDAPAYHGAARRVAMIRAEIGDLAPPLPFPRWYALMVRPQQEESAHAWLERFGVVSFYPVVEARRSRRGKTFTYQRRYLPGYLFAKFPGEPIWHVLLSSPFIRDVIRMHNGTPGILHPDTLHRLHAMRKLDLDIEARRRERRKINAGDMVRVKSGPLEGFEIETVEVDAATGKGKFSVMIFGRVSDAEMSLDNVEKL